MKVINLIILVFFVHKVEACSLSSEGVVYSLSGPVTLLFEELNLLKDPRLKGISVFHPVKNYEGGKIGGGLFLSPKIFKDDKKAIVFFDSSVELKRSLTQVPHLDLVEIRTRDLDAFDAALLSIQEVKKYLHNCDAKVERIKGNIEHIKSLFQKKKVSDKKILFFLNEIKSQGKFPPTLIVKDGFVLSLIRYANLKTYKSPLAYVSWAAKKMNSDYASYLKLGINNGISDQIVSSKVADGLYNLYYRGVLIPGIRQVYFLRDFIDWFDHKGKLN